MATLQELEGLYLDNTLRQKIRGALSIVAQEIMSSNDGSAPYGQDAGDHDARLVWASGVIVSGASLAAEAERILIFVIGANNDSTASQIQGASDSAILTNVRQAVDPLAGIS